MNIPRISAQEFAERRQAAVARARNEGLDALLVWSRGGGTVDAYGDVFYLTNFHSQFPLQPDWAGWSHRGYASLILPVDGEPVLLTDFLDDPENSIKVSDVRAVPDITVATVRVLGELGLLGKRIGLVGVNSFLASAEKRMRRALGGDKLRFEPADHILEALRLIKSEAELTAMRYSAQVGVLWMNATMGALQEGKTEGDAVGEGLKVLASNGGILHDIAIAGGPNAGNYFGSSGVPHWDVTRRFKKGDLVHCDQWGPVHGYYTDFARSTVVGGIPDSAQRELLEGSIGVIEYLIQKVQPGKTLGELFALGSKWLVENGFSGLGSYGAKDMDPGSFAALFPSFGHGLGLSLDIPNIVEDEPTIIKPNMVLALETFIHRPGVGAANFEQNVIVHADHVEVISEGCQERWWA